MQVREVEATVRGAHGDRQTGRARAAGEGDAAGRRGIHGRAVGGADVDATVLPGGVGIVTVEVVGEDLATHGPGPALGGVRRRGRGQEHRSDREARGEHSHPPRR